MASQEFDRQPGSEKGARLGVRPKEEPAPSHTVQFYEDQAFLGVAVADFLQAGLSRGQSAVVIADDSRCNIFMNRLAAYGIDTAAEIAAGRLILANAHEILDAICVEGRPDKTKFDTLVGDILTRAASTSRSQVIRAYGEMVDILWKDGRTKEAVHLEQLWNDLGVTHSFDLLCAYDMGSFYKESHTEEISRVCHAHSRVIPAESFSDDDEGERFRQIAILQQRAKSLEHEIQLRKELETQLREALAEREQLLEGEKAARQEAEAAGRAKSEFLGVMSHELRTPLNAIAGHVQLVQMGLHGPVTPDQSEALRRVERSQRHLLSLINDVLNLVRVGGGRVEYNVSRIQLRRVISDVATLIEPLLGKKDLHIETGGTTKGDSLTARADHDKVHQILINLLSNAIKFTPRGGHILVEAASSPGDPASVALRVSDNGVGIPAEKLEKIFEPFVQLSARPQSGQEGLGLGLAISRDLAVGMGGDLSVESTVGVGTTFTLKLPRG